MSPMTVFALLVLIVVLPALAAAQSVPEVVGVIAGDVEVRYPVAHLHEKAVCFGYLYFNRDTIRYAVLRPVADRGHSVIMRRTEVAEAQKRPFFVLRLAAAEFSLRSGARLAFAPVAKGAVEGNRKLEDSQLPVELLLEAANSYTELQTRLLARARSQTAAAAAATPAPPRSKPAPPANLPLPPAALIVTAQPGGAQVYVNDEFRGSTSARWAMRVSGKPR